MAAGAKAASGGSFEATLERRFRTVSNTMDSIQGLSTWCIDNKKYHSLIVRHWMKCLKKCKYMSSTKFLQTAAQEQFFDGVQF
uniref:CID domain-containing protein n=1 Tax=Oryzias sinensis TaxID=183150 RepID=A0A8C7WZH7_9TELE